MRFSRSIPFLSRRPISASMTHRQAITSPGLPLARLNRVGAGGGAFVLPDVTIGLFHVAQPDHRIAIGSDKTVTRPLAPDQGWVMPAGANGICAFDQPLDFTTVSIPGSLLAEAGARAVRPVVKTSAGLPETASLLYRQTMARALVAHLIESQPAPEADRPLVADPRLARAIGYIHDHLADDLSLDIMAGEAAMSPFHFSRVFKAATGRSPLAYVIAERMRLAAVLLRTTRLPVAEIAYRVGYEDVSRFGEHFKREHGSTPASLRA
jgi:AraC family transcriptional regulator